MFSAPGGARPARRLIAAPAPWKDDGRDSSPPIEHRRMAADTESSSTLRTDSELPAVPRARPPSRPAFIADERAGSGALATEWAAPTSAPPSTALHMTGDVDADAVAPEGELPPDMPAPIALPRREHRALCKICFGPASSAFVDMCDECRDRVEGPDDNVGTARIRTKSIRRKSGLVKRAFVFVVVGALLVVGGMGVVKHYDLLKPSSALLKGTERGSVEVRFAVPEIGVTDFRTSFDVSLRRGRRDSRLATALSSVFDVRQVSENLARMALIEVDGGAAFLNVRTASALERQDGEYVLDEVAQDIYPWDGRVEVSRVRAPERGPLALTDGSRPEAARDVPPFATFGTTGAPAGPLATGATWSGVTDLPCLAGLDGAFGTHPFKCRYEFVGQRVVDARKCAIVRVEAVPESEVGARFRDLDSASGSVTGALAFDIETGLLVSADLVVDTHTFRGDASAPEERVDMRGTLRIER